MDEAQELYHTRRQLSAGCREWRANERRIEQILHRCTRWREVGATLRGFLAAAHATFAPIVDTYDGWVGVLARSPPELQRNFVTTWLGRCVAGQQPLQRPLSVWFLSFPAVSLCFCHCVTQCGPVCLCPSVRLSVCPSVRLSICPSIPLSAPLPLCRSAALSLLIPLGKRPGFFRLGRGRVIDAIESLSEMREYCREMGLSEMGGDVGRATLMLLRLTLAVQLTNTTVAPQIERTKRLMTMAFGTKVRTWSRLLTQTPEFVALLRRLYGQVWPPALSSKLCSRGSPLNTIPVLCALDRSHGCCGLGRT